MNFGEIENKGVWKNEGYEETIESLRDSKIHVLAVEFIVVEYEHDSNLSTAFQMRHVVDDKGNRGFAYYVSHDQVFPYPQTFRLGTSQKVRDKVLKEGIVIQQEALRQSWLNLNRR